MNNEHERLQNLTEDEVFAELGKALLGEVFGTTRLSEEEAARAGRSWFESILPAIRERVCGNPRVEELLLSGAAAARNTALLAVLDTSLSAIVAGLPVATISHAVVLYGIHKICEGQSKGVES